MLFTLVLKQLKELKRKVWLNFLIKHVCVNILVLKTFNFKKSKLY